MKSSFLSNVVTSPELVLILLVFRVPTSSKSRLNLKNAVSPSCSERYVKYPVYVEEAFSNVIVAAEFVAPVRSPIRVSPTS